MRDPRAVRRKRARYMRRLAREDEHNGNFRWRHELRDSEQGDRFTTNKSRRETLREFVLFYLSDTFGRKPVTGKKGFRLT